MHRHPRDDLRENLVMLCGDGTTGCHGLVTANDASKMLALGRHLLYERPDTILYLERKLQGPEARAAWMSVEFGV